MDLCAIAPNTKEKRERQPNWTEAEKQLLLSLTRIHKVILENKCSDTMTIRKKSEAWDDIAAHMRAAGYQRSKDRLKQQLGRMRAAEAKRVRDAISMSQAQDKSLVIADCSPKFSATTTPMNTQVIQNITTQMHEVEIKIEKPIALEEFEKPYEKQSNKDDSEINGFSSTCSRSPTPHSHELNRKSCQDSQYFTLNPLFVRETDGDESERKLPISSISRNSHCRCNCSKKKLRNVRLRINGYSPRTPAQRVRQLHFYRVAVEKERLKMLRMQQKRDRIFYRKDKEIQNLKLQILRNLAVTRANHFNFN